MKDTGQGIAASLIPDLQQRSDASSRQDRQRRNPGLMRGRATHANLEGVAELAEQVTHEPVQTFKQMVWEHDTGIAFLRQIKNRLREQMPLIARAWVQQQFEKGVRGRRIH